MKDIKTYAILFFLFLALIFLCLWRCDRPSPSVQKYPTDSLKGVIRIKDTEIAILRAKISRQSVKHLEIKKEAAGLPRIKEIPKTTGDSVLRHVATEKERLLDESLANAGTTLELVAVEHKKQEVKDSLVKRVFYIDSTQIKEYKKEVARLNKKVLRRDFWIKIEAIGIVILGGILLASN